MKGITKDIDLVINNKTEFEGINEALRKTGLKRANQMFVLEAE